MAGLYLHIPFCASFCIYCDFYSEVAPDRVEAYLEALSREAEARKNELSVPPSTVYIGGGTPSLLSEAQFPRLCGILQDHFDLSAVEEFTVEANPDDVTPEKLSLWRSCGVNRLSLGVQSFCDGHLKWMRRRHDAARARAAFRLAREAGFGNISLDLIFGYAGLSSPEWKSSVDEAVALRPQHISCYQMMLEEGTPLSALAASGRYCEPPQEECAAQYAFLQKRLAEAGYIQYEISNFALPGCESKHNSAYWRREPYLGLGPAAHSFDGDRRRSWNDPDLEGWIGVWNPASEGQRAAEPFLPQSVASRQEEPAAPQRHRTDSFEILSDKDVFNETVMLSLRTARGLDLAELDPQLLEETRPAFERAVACGNLVRTPDGRLRIPPERFFISDFAIIGEII
ncbi:MAG: radical SAM family heme chaperone HemW [Bacteroidales bacterium]|nr:radical SAM family heme chaperone HemW [Bacteroidales bacterium]